MTQELRERVAVTEKRIEDLIYRLDIKNDKIDRIASELSIISSRYCALENKFDAFTTGIEEKLRILLDRQEDFKSQFNEKSIIDRTQLEIEEKQKRHLIKILGIIGTLVISIVSNIDKLQDTFSSEKSTPTTIPTKQSAVSFNNYPSHKSARLFVVPFLLAGSKKFSLVTALEKDNVHKENHT